MDVDTGLRAEDEVVDAADALFDARGHDRRDAEAALRRAVKRLRRERADEANEEESEAA